MRHLALALLLVTGPCFAQSALEASAPRESVRRDGFVIAGDACGARRYQSLVGQSYALVSAALPAGTVVHGPARDGAVQIDHRLQSGSAPITLEYRAQRLNVVVDATSRILAIACH